MNDQQGKKADDSDKQDMILLDENLSCICVECENEMIPNTTNESGEEVEITADTPDGTAVFCPICFMEYELTTDPVSGKRAIIPIESRK